MRTYSFFEFLELSIETSKLQTDEEFSFSYIDHQKEVLEEEKVVIHRVKIPMIQRDYAQGRSDQYDLRKDFVNDLFQALETEKELKLDFIYGSVSTEKEHVFLPLDGQQRLTTLFLLHWLIVKLDHGNINASQSLLEKFSYETRDTARKFFQKLVDFKFDGHPVYSIKNSHWFKDSYKLDPTIMSSLNMLDTLYERYLVSNYKAQLYNQLDKLRFYVLPMNNFNLSDDLYIKLNARGKTLSPFENLKADLLGWMSTINDFQKHIDETDAASLTRIESIASKFDNKWADLFWKGINNFDENVEANNIKSIDAYIFKFIHRLMINDYIHRYSGTDILKDVVYVELLKKEEKPYFSNLDFYKNHGLITVEFVDKLEIILDYYTCNDHASTIQNSVAPVWNKGFKWSVFQGKFSMNERLLFDSINQFILNNPKHLQRTNVFKDWIRIVWNLIIDPDNRSIGVNKRVMEVIREIAIYSNDISKSLEDGDLDELIESFNNVEKLQLNEEINKINKIKFNPDWQGIIDSAESHHLFTGNIGFIILDIDNVEIAKKRLNIAEKLFDTDGAQEFISNKQHVLMRLVISEFSEWTNLENFNLGDSELNWKTYLRRNKHVKKTISKLLSMDDMEAVEDYIVNSISRDSLIIDTSSRRLAHKHLYFDDGFHLWMQKNGANKIKWLWDHIYVIEPRAWYNKVMIDCFRNEIISHLVKEFNIDDIGNHQCSNTSYYKMENIEILKNSNAMKISFFFDKNNTLTIGVKHELNPQFSPANNDDVWIESVDFNYVENVQHLNDIIAFIDGIKKELSNTNYLNKL